MIKNNFWFLSLIALLIIAHSTAWPLLLRVAVAANAIVIFIEIFRKIRRLHNGKQQEEN